MFIETSFQVDPIKPERNILNRGMLDENTEMRFLLFLYFYYLSFKKIFFRDIYLIIEFLKCRYEA